MGATMTCRRVPFASVNLSRDPRYREGWVRHHLHPLQCARDPGLAPFIEAMRDDGYHLDDFRMNGVLLPTLPSLSSRTGLPLHLVGHPNYNVRIIDELHAIRVFAESIRTEALRRRIALLELRALQRRVHAAVRAQRFGHVDDVVLRWPDRGSSASAPRVRQATDKNEKVRLAHRTFSSTRYSSL